MNKKINLIITKNLKEKLESCAKNEEITMSQLIRNILRDYVNKNYHGELQKNLVSVIHEVKK